MTIKQIPNFITALRIAGTLIMMFMNPFTAGFFVTYTLCGLSDVVDGVIARKYNASSEFGAKLDSIADLLFYAVMLIKIMPVLWAILPGEMWYAIGAIVLMRIVSYTIAGIKYKRFASHHTYLNKVTGFGIFAIPYFIKQSFAVPFCMVVCAISGIATIEELLMHIFCKEYHSDMKTIFWKKIKTE